MNDLPTIDPALGAREGTIDFRGYRVWYAIIGEKEEPSGKLPLLCLHGGPGACHDYLEALAAMAKGGRRVIFYDRLGCGNSDQPDNPSLWTVPLFVEEVGVVRRELGLDRLHLLGQSWGGMLAMEYALTQPVGNGLPHYCLVAGQHDPVGGRGEPSAGEIARGRTSDVATPRGRRDDWLQ